MVDHTPRSCGDDNLELRSHEAVVGTGRSAWAVAAPVRNCKYGSLAEALVLDSSEAVVDMDAADTEAEAAALMTVAA